MKVMRLTTVILLLGSFAVRAQDEIEIKAKLKTRLEEKLAVKVEYFGELVLHPGLSIGIENTLAKNNWIMVHWDIDLGGYWHRWNNTTVFLKTSIGSRLAMGKIFADMNLGVGYMHSWAAGTMYQRTEDGGLKKAANWGHPYLMPTASFLLGYDGSKRNNLPWTVHIGPEVYLQYPYNHLFIPHVAAKIGFTYKFNQR